MTAFGGGPLDESLVLGSRSSTLGDLLESTGESVSPTEQPPCRSPQGSLFSPRSHQGWVRRLSTGTPWAAWLVRARNLPRPSFQQELCSGDQARSPGRWASHLPFPGRDVWEEPEFSERQRPGVWKLEGAVLTCAGAASGLLSQLFLLKTSVGS